MSDPVEIELVNIDSITSSGAKFWGRVKVLKLWPDGDGYIYNESEHEDEWVEGYSVSTGSVSEENDHLYLHASNSSALAVRTWVTGEKVDLTNFDTLYVDWENLGDDSIANSSILNISDDKDGTHMEFEEQILVRRDFSRQTDSLDISELSDEWYVRAHARDSYTNGATDSTVKVYKVWLEEDE